MSVKFPDPVGGSSDEELDPCGWDWGNATIEHGTSVFVRALQMLGMELAEAVPNKIREKAITDLDVTPTSDLIIGRFDKTPTKERLLRLSRTKLMKCFPFKHMEHYEMHWGVVGWIGVWVHGGLEYDKNCCRSCPEIHMCDQRKTFETLTHEEYAYPFSFSMYAQHVLYAVVASSIEPT